MDVVQAIFLLPDELLLLPLVLVVEVAGGARDMSAVSLGGVDDPDEESKDSKEETTGEPNSLMFFAFVAEKTESVTEISKSGVVARPPSSMSTSTARST